jgi:hypothetical protein
MYSNFVAMGIKNLTSNVERVIMSSIMYSIITEQARLFKNTVDKLY